MIITMVAVIAVFSQVPQHRYALSNTEIQIDLQQKEDHLNSIDHVAQENRDAIKALTAIEQLHHEELQSSIDQYKGAVYCFGSIAVIIQILLFIKKKKEEE